MSADGIIMAAYLFSKLEVKQFFLSCEHSVLLSASACYFRGVKRNLVGDILWLLPSSQYVLDHFGE